MSYEVFKQGFACVACGYVGGFFGLGVCGCPVSVELWFCWVTVSDGYSFVVDGVLVQGNLAGYKVPSE